MNEKQLQAAKRVLDLIPEWDRNPDQTEKEAINDIYNDISTEPETVINFLLDIIDELNA